MLREVISLSWRSILSGLRPHETLSDNTIEDADRSSRLIAAATPILDRMREDLAGGRYGVLLADRHARLVDIRVGQQSIRTRLEKDSAVPGRMCTRVAILRQSTGPPALCGPLWRVGRVFRIGNPARATPTWISQGMSVLEARGGRSVRRTGVVRLVAVIGAGTRPLQEDRRTAAEDDPPQLNQARGQRLHGAHPRYSCRLLGNPRSNAQ